MKGRGLRRRLSGSLMFLTLLLGLLCLVGMCAGRESYILFQSRVLAEYDNLRETHGFHVVDATLSLEKTQTRMRRLLSPIIRSLG